MTRRARPGFTLMEVLIAASLSGLVMALTVGGLSQLNRFGSRQVSVAQVREEANDAVKDVVTLLRRATVIYYDPRPIEGSAGTQSTPADVSNPNALAAPAYRGAIPPVLQASVPLPNPAAPANPKNRFRFSGTLYGGAYMTDDLLVPNVVNGAVDVLAQRFQNPLVYWGEAQYVTMANAPGLGNNTAALIPQSWTFYVLYVAPMGVTGNHPGIANQSATSRDTFVAVNGTRPRRNAQPLELRLLTYPGVRADNLAAIPADANPTARRMMDRRDLTRNRVLPPPFDFDRPRGFTPNYDPVPVPYNGASLLATNELTTPTYTGVSANPPYAAFTNGASGNRVTSANVVAHANFGDIGNDPPTATALASRNAGAPPITDRVIARFIDPDAPLGTSVRLANSVGQANETARTNPDNAAPGGWYRRPYVPTHGVHCDFLAQIHANPNRYNRPAMAGTAMGANGNLPQRALVSIALRLRARIDVPFETVTTSQEVDLEGIRLFQQAVAKSRQ